MDCNIVQVQHMKSLKADAWTSDCLDADIKSMPNHSGLWLIFTNRLYNFSADDLVV